MDGQIDGLLHMLGTMYRWCVDAFNTGLWNIPTPVDQVLHGRVIQTHVKIDTLFEQWWPPEQHPEEIRVRVAPARSTRIIGSHLLAAEL